MKAVVEYALFNQLPQGMKIDDIPEKDRWLYEEHFGRIYEKHERSAAYHRARDLNAERRKNPPKTLIPETIVVVRSREVAYTDWD